MAKQWILAVAVTAFALATAVPVAAHDPPGTNSNQCGSLLFSRTASIGDPANGGTAQYLASIAFKAGSDHKVTFTNIQQGDWTWSVRYYMNLETIEGGTPSEKDHVKSAGYPAYFNMNMLGGQTKNFFGLPGLDTTVSVTQHDSMNFDSMAAADVECDESVHSANAFHRHTITVTE